jgi:hypothetical protein
MVAAASRLAGAQGVVQIEGAPFIVGHAVPAALRHGTHCVLQA